MKKEKCYNVFIYAQNRKRGVPKKWVHRETTHVSKRRAVKIAREYINRRLPYCYEGTELSFRIKVDRYVPMYIPHHRKRYGFRKRIIQIIKHIQYVRTRNSNA